MSANKPRKAPEPFIRLLKKAMDEHPEGLSLREVARRADLSPAYLSYLLSGERGVPSNDAISRLETVLRIPPGVLFRAAGKHEDAALEFFRKEDGAEIMRTLAVQPQSRLSKLKQIIERYVRKEEARK